MLPTRTEQSNKMNTYISGWSTTWHCTFILYTQTYRSWNTDIRTHTQRDRQTEATT